MPRLIVTARFLKVTIPLDPAAVGALPIPDGERVELAVNCDGQLYAANIAVRSWRKVKKTIADNGAESTFVALQGKLGRNSEILEGGLTAQVKARALPAAEPETNR